MESKNTPPAGSLGASWSVMARELPSADQATDGPGEDTSANLRSEPPIGGTRNTANLPPLNSRRKAMERPSGDQAGQESAAGSLVRRSGCPPGPTSFT